MKLLDKSDVELGKYVRQFVKDVFGQDDSINVEASVCALLLVDCAAKIGATTGTIKADGVYGHDGEEMGDWVVIVNKVN